MSNGESEGKDRDELRSQECGGGGKSHERRMSKALEAASEDIGCELGDFKTKGGVTLFSMSRERPHPPFGFECFYQHNCPHMSGMSAHHAKLVINNAPHERSELYQRIDSYRKDLEEAHQRIKELKKEAAYYKTQWQLLHRKQFKANKTSHTSSTTSSPPDPGGSTSPNKRGVPKGHPGWYRKKPQHVDRTIEVPAPEKCPDCGSQWLQSIPQRWEHLQEDIVLQPRAHVTCFDHAQAYCSCCDRQVVATAEGEILNAPIGPVAKATAT